MLVNEVAEYIIPPLQATYEEENFTVETDSDTMFRAYLTLKPASISDELSIGNTMNKTRHYISMTLQILIYANCHVDFSVAELHGTEPGHNDKINALVTEIVDSQPSDADSADMLGDWVVSALYDLADRFSDICLTPISSEFDALNTKGARPANPIIAKSPLVPLTPVGGKAQLDAEMKTIDDWEELKKPDTTHQSDPAHLLNSPNRDNRVPSGLSVSVPSIKPPPIGSYSLDETTSQFMRVQLLLVHLMLGTTSMLSKSKSDRENLIMYGLNFLKANNLLSESVMAMAKEPQNIVAKLLDSFGISSDRTTRINIAGMPVDENAIMRLLTTPMDALQATQSLMSRFRTDFEQENVIGAGAFGQVVRAKNIVDGHEYAVKKILMRDADPDREKLLNEVNTLASVHHPYIVRYYTAWIEESDGSTFSRDAGLESDSESDSSGWSPAAVDTVRSAGPDYDESTHSVLPPHLQGPTTFSESVLGDMAGVPSYYTGEDDETSEDYYDDTEDGAMSVGDGITFDDLQAELDGAGAYDPFHEPVDVPEEDFLQAPDYTSPVYKEALFAPHSSGSESSHWRTMGRRKHTPCAPSSSSSESQSPVAPASAAQSPNGDRILFIQMELCDGQSLRSALDDGLDTLGTARERFQLFARLVEALAHIHAKSIIHRDLKPANIFLDKNQYPKLGDFGLAVSQTQTTVMAMSKANSLEDMRGDDTDMGEHTLNIGTLLYMAPELDIDSLSRGQYTTKVDVYALGVVLLELFYPFATGMEKRMIVADLVGDKRTLPEHFVKSHARIAKLIMDLTEPNPNDRPSAQELLDKELEPTRIRSCNTGLEELRKLIESDVDGATLRRQMAEALVDAKPPDVVEEASVEEATPFNNSVARSCGFIESYIRTGYMMGDAVNISSDPYTYITDHDASFHNPSLKAIDYGGRAIEIPFDLTTGYITKLKHLLDSDPKLGLPHRWIRRFELSGVLRPPTPNTQTALMTTTDGKGRKGPVDPANSVIMRYRLGSIDLTRTFDYSVSRIPTMLASMGVMEAEAIAITTNHAVLGISPANSLTLAFSDSGILIDILTLCGVPPALHMDIARKMTRGSSALSYESRMQAARDLIIKEAGANAYGLARLLLFPSDKAGGIDVASTQFNTWLDRVVSLIQSTADAMPQVTLDLVIRVTQLVSLTRGTSSLLHASDLAVGAVLFSPAVFPEFSVYSGLVWRLISGQVGKKSALLLAIGGQYSHKLNTSGKLFPNRPARPTCEALSSMAVVRSFFPSTQLSKWVATVSKSERGSTKASEPFMFGVGMTVRIDDIVYLGMVEKMSEEMLARKPGHGVYITGDMDPRLRTSHFYYQEKLALAQKLRSKGYRVIFSMFDSKEELESYRDPYIAYVIEILESAHRDARTDKASKRRANKTEVRPDKGLKGPVGAATVDMVKPTAQAKLPGEITPQNLDLSLRLLLTRKESDQGMVTNVIGLFKQLDRFEPNKAEQEEDEKKGERKKGEKKKGKRGKPVS
ncbi:Protein kinase domain [Carpediemonas membranifera]|uniref:Protein kinase domain n=1 Tax=Carpediemonas membranifera TaxID=201153 RepID=A0A8J6E7I2_9EUKA|nr:Protein kinase domain [Carpediemonas membranifera]|eukprot:KAG9390745.1 Protein kinase domain [Carpediemonas membranifera]